LIRSISKTLSGNDVGVTGGHQAGMLVPKDPRILGFFPKLDASTLNPRTQMRFHDDAGSHLDFWFIYYNNRFFGGTRNEYRLTHMTKWIRQSGLQEGDEILMTRTENGAYAITQRRKVDVPVIQDGVLMLGSGWKIIDLAK
jgi:hypothetical protein